MNQPMEYAGPPVALPSRVGQATAVEQSRAVAEVQAAIVVAQQCPRSVPAALAMMRESCSQPGLANRAFYEYKRGSQFVGGETVHLARELARCWGNIDYGISELRRDDDAGQSEMKAWAWDVQTNARSSQTFIVPHKRDRAGGPVALKDLREVYENNANNGARRLREAIFSVIPVWFREEAAQLCRNTIEHGGGEPLSRRIANALSMFEEVGVTADQLAEKVGRPVEKWTAHDVARLGVTYQSIQRGELAQDEAFPPPRVTVEEIKATAKPAPEANGQASDTPRPNVAPIPGSES